MGMYIPEPSGTGSDDEEKQRLLRDYLASSQASPAASGITSGGPTTQLEKTGNAAMQDDAPPEPEATPVAPPAPADLPAPAVAPPVVAAPVQAPQDDKRDVLMQLLAQKGIDRLNKPDAPDQKPVDINDSGSLNPFAALGSVAALALDAKMNRGRGAGQIVGATANNIDADLRARQEEQVKLAEIAARRKDENDPLKQYLGMANVNARDYANLVSQQRANTGARTANARIDPNSVEGQGLVAQDENRATAKTKGRVEETHIYAPIITQDDVDRTRAVDQTHADVKHENAQTVASDSAAKIGTETPARADQAEAIINATAPTKERITAAGQDHARALALGQTGPQQASFPDTEITDPGAHAAMQANPANRNKELLDLQATRQLDQSMAEMARIRAANGILPMNGQARSDYEAAYGNAMGAIAKKRSFGTLQENERKIIEESLPGPGPHLSDARDALSHFVDSGSKQDTVLEQIRGAQKEFRSAAEAKAAVNGYRPLWDVRHDAAPTTSAAADGGDPLHVAVTGGRPGKEAVSATPPLPADAVKGSKGPGLDENGLSTEAAPTKVYHYRSRKTGKIIPVSATAAEKSARPGLDWVD